MEPAPERSRKTTWKEFLSRHWEMIVATDFFTVEVWTRQIARNLADSEEGILIGKRYLIHDCDPLFTAEFLNMITDAGVKSVKLPPRSPNLKDYASHCTSFALPDVTSSAAPRSDSLWPWDLCGGLFPGASYRHSFLSL